MDSALPGQLPITDQPKGRDDAYDAVDEDITAADGFIHLDRTDKAVVQQLLSPEEGCCCGYEDENRFEVLDRYGHVILKAQEDSNCCSRQCCDQLRGFHMDLVDRNGVKVISIDRPFRCNNSFFCPCMEQNMIIESPPGVKVGSIDQNFSWIRPKMEVKNSEGKTIYRIEGPGGCKCRCPRPRLCCAAVCCSRRNQRFCCSGTTSLDVEFIVVDAKTGEEKGKIARKWNGVSEASAVASEMDRFGVDFPQEVDTGVKATLLAACFLIDYLYFEFEGENKDIAAAAE